MAKRFDDIRCYGQEDWVDVSRRLWNDPEFLTVLDKSHFPLTAAQMRDCALSLGNLERFHEKMVHPLLSILRDRVCQSLESEGLDRLKPGKGHLFISNHRDIITDSAFLNSLLMDRDLRPSCTAIGDNLLIRPWINDAVRLIKSFIVKRNLPIKEQLLASHELSAYIHECIGNGEPVWLANHEGRSKDSDDRTQISILKMLILEGDSNVLSNLQSLNPVPLSISYEYDPCDYLKAQEMQLKRDFEGYRKSPEDDMLNMKTGLSGYKGRVFYHADTDFGQQLATMDADRPKKDLLEAIAGLIDRSIHAHYRLYPNNYIAADMLDGQQGAELNYTPSDRKKFDDYIQQQLQKVGIPESAKDVSFLRTKLLEMYANPVRNKRKSRQN